MRNGKKLVAFVLALDVAIVVLVVGVYLWRNPETKTLDAAARVGMPGSFVTLPDGVTHYESSAPDSGLDNGRVAVLVHGFSVPYYIWDSTAVMLHNAGYRTVRYDLYGRGMSDRPDVAYDGALYDRQLMALLDSLHIDKPVDLMGLSYGGFVTGHFVASHADRIRTLTLLDPAAGGGRVPGVLAVPGVGNWMWQVMRAPSAALGQPSDFLHPERWPDWVAKYEPQMQYKGFGRALRRSSIAQGETDYRAHYAAVGKTGVPVLLIWGKQDSTVSITKSSVVRDGIPGAEWVPVDSAGHLPGMEQPAVVKAAMLGFLGRH